ncbi:MAG: hypothetical protein MR270_06380 [Erysipelotrichaceae bacterium]|nr:hypothetical protein [Erysipelotrichaceae bacterium]
MNGNQNEQISRLTVQIAFLSAIIFAVSLSISAIFMYINIINNPYNIKSKLKKIYKISLLASIIFLICNIYFFILSYDDYKNEKSKATFDYYEANVLSLTAQSIRFNTLLKYPERILGAEDII